MGGVLSKVYDFLLFTHALDNHSPFVLGKQVCMTIYCFIAGMKRRRDQQLTSLHIACMTGDKEWAQRLISKDTNSINDCNISGWTPLMFAVVNRKRNIFELLLQNKPLLDLRNDEGMSALDYACIKQNKAMAHRLLDEQLKKGTIDKALWCSSFCGCVPLAERLIKQGADVNCGHKDDTTAVFIASQEGQLELLKLLVKHNGDVNSVRNDQVSPLIMATRRGHSQCVEFLIESKAQIDHQDRMGETALFSACNSGLLGIAKVLLLKGANVNLPTKDTRTPLWIAVYKNNAHVVELLLKFHADVNIKRIDGISPLIVARGRNSTLVNLLRKNNAHY